MIHIYQKEGSTDKFLCKTDTEIDAVAVSHLLPEGEWSPFYPNVRAFYILAKLHGFLIEAPVQIGGPAATQGDQMPCVTKRLYVLEHRSGPKVDTLVVGVFSTLRKAIQGIATFGEKNGWYAVTAEELDTGDFSKGRIWFYDANGKSLEGQQPVPSYNVQEDADTRSEVDKLKTELANKERKLAVFKEELGRKDSALRDLHVAKHNLDAAHKRTLDELAEARTQYANKSDGRGMPQASHSQELIASWSEAALLRSQKILAWLERDAAYAEVERLTKELAAALGRTEKVGSKDA